jgi:hypothetical protein
MPWFNHSCLQFNKLVNTGPTPLLRGPAPVWRRPAGFWSSEQTAAGPCKRRMALRYSMGRYRAVPREFTMSRALCRFLPFS